MGQRECGDRIPAYVNNGEVWSSYAARWNMDDEEGPTILDSSPNQKSRTEDRGDLHSVGCLGWQLRIFPTGRTDGIKIPASPNFDLGSSFTGSMWMKFEGTAVTTGNTNDINYHRIFSAKRWWNQKSVSKL